MITLVPHAEGTVVPVRAQPGARRNGILGERHGALRVAVSAAPERGKANEAIQQMLAETLGCKRSQVRLLQGETARDKKFLIRGLTIAELLARISGLISDDLTTEHTETTERKTESRGDSPLRSQRTQRGRPRKREMES